MLERRGDGECPPSNLGWHLGQPWPWHTGHLEPVELWACPAEQKTEQVGTADPGHPSPLDSAFPVPATSMSAPTTRGKILASLHGWTGLKVALLSKTHTLEGGKKQGPRPHEWPPLGRWLAEHTDMLVPGSFDLLGFSLVSQCM